MVPKEWKDAFCGRTSA